jgi:hypothetical protein
MNDDERAALLNEILKQPASEMTWRLLWELFGSWPEGMSKIRHVEVALQALATWPDKLRFVHSSNGLLYDGQRLSMLGRLAKSIVVYRREEHGSRELFALASSEYSSDLTYLSIEGSEIDARTWRALAESQHLTHLRHLHVRKTLLNDADVQYLFQTSRLPLECLKLIDVGLRWQTLGTLHQPPPMRNLCALDLSSNGLGDEGVTALSRLPWLSQIRRLTVRSDYITAEGIQALLASPFCESS